MSDASKPSSRRTQVGTVVSNKMDRTVVVMVQTKVQHPIYKKYVSRRKKFYAHDELECNEGDEVLIEECRPLSRLKRWSVREIKRRAVG